MNDIYNGLRAFLFLAVIAFGTVWCITEQGMTTDIPPDPEPSTIETLTVDPWPVVDIHEDPQQVKEKAVSTTTARPKAKPAQTTTAKPAPEPEPTIRYQLTDEERKVVEAVVAAEAGGEDFDGQCLVAQCILNTAEIKDKRPDDIVLTPGQYTAPAYDRRDLVADAVSAVFDDGYTVTDEPIQYFYAPKWCTSTWHESLDFVIEHGGHRFFAAW